MSEPTTQAKPSLVGKILGWVIPVLILAAATTVFFAMGSQPPPGRKSVEPPAAAPVQTAAVRLETEGIDVEADGVVVPLREITLAAEVPGRVRLKSAACRAGKYVTRGTLLFEIDPRDYELDVARFERELTQAGLMIEEIDEEVIQNASSIDLSQRQVGLAGREVNRLDNLRANRIVTESDHERSQRDELSAANTLTALQGLKRVLVKRRNRMVEAQALAATALERARLDLSRTRVVAPADGVVVDDKVEQDSFVAKGTPLVTIEDTSAAEVKTSLQMDEVARIWGGRRPAGEAASTGAHDLPDTPATVVFKLGDRVYQWKGTLSRQEGRGLDEKTRTLPCRVIVPDPTAVQSIDSYGAVSASLPPEAPRSLLRGMFVEVRVHVDNTSDLVSIPEASQRPSGEVWLMRDGRLVTLRPHPLQVSGGRAVYEVVTSGLLPDDRVVISQLANPRDGMLVAEREVAGSSREPLQTADAAESPRTP